MEKPLQGSGSSCDGRDGGREEGSLPEAIQEDSILSWNEKLKQLPEFKYRSKLNISEELEGENFLNASKVDIPRLNPVDNIRNGTFVGLGSGPSVKTFINELSSAKDQFFCFTKSGHDYYKSKGIFGHCLLLDGRERSAVEFLKPDKRNIYYIASHCHPKMFELTEGFERYLFHCTTNKNWIKHFNPRGISILGGTTSVGRMVGFGHAIGFRKFVFFGTDCSFDIDGEPLHPYLLPQPPGTKIYAMVVECLGKYFLTNSQFLQQLHDFDRLIAKSPELDIRFAGDGLMQWRYNNLSKDGVAPNIIIHRVYGKPERKGLKNGEIQR